MSVWSARQHALRVYLKVTHVCATLVCHEYESPYCHCQRHALHSLLNSACQCGVGVLAAPVAERHRAAFAFGQQSKASLAAVGDANLQARALHASEVFTHCWSRRCAVTVA
jgi:hypothetical protein